MSHHACWTDSGQAAPDSMSHPRSRLPPSIQTRRFVMWWPGRGGCIMLVTQGRSKRWNSLRSTGWHVLEHSSVKVGASPGCPISVTVLMRHLRLTYRFGSECKYRSGAEAFEAALLGLGAEPAPLHSDTKYPVTGRASCGRGTARRAACPSCGV